jgi:hypothetical protein
LDAVRVTKYERSPSDSEELTFQQLTAKGFLITASIWSLVSVGWLVADGWCWFVLREEYCWLVLAGCWWLVCSERKVLLAGG